MDWDQVFDTYVHPQDIVSRLSRLRKNYIPDNQDVKITGQEGAWGKVELVLGSEVIRWRAYIKNAPEMERVAKLALEYFYAIIQV